MQGVPYSHPLLPKFVHLIEKNAAAPSRDASIPPPPPAWESNREGPRAYGRATHLALDHSPLIFGISASAALPVAARGGLHGGAVCVSCVHSLFCLMCAGRGRVHPGPTRACRGLPESSPQCENVCGLLLRPKRSRLRETRWGATKGIHRGG